MCKNYIHGALQSRVTSSLQAVFVGYKKSVDDEDLQSLIYFGEDFEGEPIEGIQTSLAPG